AFKAEKFFAYFQAFSNTYAPLPVLRERYEVIRRFPRIVGLSVGTRPDCVSRPVIELLAHFCETHEVWVEYGLQSAHDETLKRVNRGHRVADFLEAVERTRPFGIRICAHVILGLPGEDRGMMMETARFLAGLPIDGVKIHLLHIMRGTPYETMFRQGKIGVLSEGAYVSLVCDFLERLPPHFTIQRLTANAPPDILVAPAWCRSQRATRNAIEAELRRRKSFQGRVFLAERRGSVWRAGAATG
ncbi:MAG: TIGR01212 family radical SAM protein, partial [Deltaproteobacteria bacterium]